MQVMKKAWAVILTAAAVALAAPRVSAAAIGPVVIDRIVAIVNGEIITLSDLQREMEKRKDGADERLVLEDMIDRKLQMAAAKKDGMAVTDGELDEAISDIQKRNHMDEADFKVALAKEGLTLEQYRTELREQMTISRLFNKYVRSGLTVSDAEARAYYDRNLQHYRLPEEVRIRQLVVALPPKASPADISAARQKAEELMARVRKGEDFAELIREYSEGPVAAEGGDLGFLQRGHLLPVIEAAAKDLKPGEYAGPVKSADGFHIIRLEEVRTPVRSFEDVKDEITKLLFDQKMRNSYQAWLQTLRSDSQIENRL